VSGLYDNDEYISIYQDTTLSKNLFDNLLSKGFTTVIEKTVNLRTNILYESKHSVFIMNYKNVYNDYFKKNFLVNLAGDAAGLRAQTDNKFNKWTVSAGETRGILKGGTLVHSFPKNIIDDMYLKGINSFIRDSQGNIRLYGNRIMTFSFSSLNRITTRNLFNHLSKNLEKFARLFVFDFISSNTTNAIKSILNRFMENVKADRGVSEYDVQVSTDEINNIITVDIFVRPVNAIDYIQLRFENAGNNSITNIRSSI
jgi:phage tail sheath protein FI